MAASTGCYLLVVVAEPATDDQKNVILQRLSKGLLSWDIDSTGCDLQGLETTCASVKEKDNQDSDLLIQYSTESLGVEVLVNPPVSTLKQCVKNLLTSTIGHKHIIHAGYTFTGSGSWILQNGNYSFQDLLAAFQDVKGITQRGATIHIHCAEEGDWTSENFSKESFSKIANVLLNPPDKHDHLPGSEHLIDCLETVLNTQSLTEIMEASPLVGNIRFNRPTLYLFPAGEGDCALFGINGFNMLIDGGFNRKPCSWDFIRHLDRLDAVLVTQLSENNLCSMSTLMKRKYLNNTYPQIGYVFCNIAEGKNPSPTEETPKEKNDLLVSVVGEGHKFIQTLNDLKLVPHQCWRDSALEPFVLYHKVGHGTLEMHILSPPKDSKEMVDFLSEWSAYKEKFSSVKFKGQVAPIPLSHATSVCAIIVWRPNDPKDTITRILFPGSAPQSKILEGLDKIKNLDILRHPTVTKASLSPLVLTKPKIKTATPAPKATIPNRKNTASPALSVTSVASRNGDIAGPKKDAIQVKDSKTVKEVKKSVKEPKKEVKPVREVKKEIKKEIKKEKEVKKEPKKEVKPAVEKTPVTKTTVKKTESAKASTDVKKTSTVKKTVAKKEVSSKPPVAKAAEIKKVAKTVESKATKEAPSKKSADAKPISKLKSKSATKSAAKTKPTPVPKSPSKLTRAIAASAAVATAAVTVGVAELIESKREETEKEEILKIEIDEQVAEKIPETLQNGHEEAVEEIEDHIEVPMSPVRMEAVSPALSEPVSLTASDTLSSAPMETVSPTPPLHDIISPAEEKEVNEIKAMDVQTPTDFDDGKFPDHEEVDENVHTPTYDEDEIESAVDEGIVEDNDDDKLENEPVLTSTADITEQEHESTDLMTASFVGDTLKPTDEEKFVSDTAIPTETTCDFKEDITASADCEKEQVEHAIDDLEMDEHIEDGEDEMHYDINKQLASATMEGSFCAGYNTEDHETIEAQIIDSKGYSTEGYEPTESHITDNVEYSTEGYEIVEHQTTESAGYSAEDYERIETQMIDPVGYSTEDHELIQTQTTDDSVGYSVEDHEPIQPQTTDSLRYSAEDQEPMQPQAADSIEFSAGDHESIHPQTIDSVGYSAEDHEPTQLQSTDSVGYVTEDYGSAEHELADTLINNDEMAVDDIPESMKTSIYEEKEECDMSDDYVQKIINQYKEPSEDTLGMSHDKQDPSYCLGNDYKESEVISGENYSAVVSEMHEVTKASTETIYSHQLELGHVSSDVESDKEQYDKETLDDQAHYKNEISTPPTYGEPEPEELNVERQLDAESVKLAAPEFDPVDKEARELEGSDLCINEQDMLTNASNAIDQYDLGKYEKEEMELRQEAEGHDETNNRYQMHEDTIADSENLDTVESHEERDHYPTEDKQDLDEKDHDSAEEFDDGEMIRHPTPPTDESNFYHRYPEDEMKDPIGQHYINPSAYANTAAESSEPLYEEPEDSDSERSASPVPEQPIFSNIEKADYPELVTVSGGTTPSEPQSPKSPLDAKKTNIAALEVMEALSEHDCSESSNQSPLVRDGLNTFDINDVEPIVGYSNNEPPSDLEFNQNAEVLTSQLNESMVYDCQKESETHLSAEQAFETYEHQSHDQYSVEDPNVRQEPFCDLEITKASVYESEDEDSDVYRSGETSKLTSEQIGVDYDDNTDGKRFGLADNMQDLISEPERNFTEVLQLDEQQTVHDLPPTTDMMDDVHNFSSKMESEPISAPMEFSAPHGTEELLMSERTDVEFGDQYSSEQNNRYSSASTVELDNSKHSNENVSSFDISENERQNLHQMETTCERNDQQPEKISSHAEDFETLSANDDGQDVSYGKSVADENFPENDGYYSNGFSTDKPVVSTIEKENVSQCDTVTVSSVDVNGQGLKSYENTFGDYESTLNHNETQLEENVNVPTDEPKASYMADSHYQSDSPESDNSMKPDTPEVLSQSDSENEPLGGFDVVNNKYLYNTGEFPYENTDPPQNEFDVVNKKFSYREEYVPDNLNNLSTVPAQQKTMSDVPGEHYVGTSEDEEGTSIPGNVSPYAYTNEAYNQEDDADGNHIYKHPDSTVNETTPTGMISHPTAFDMHQVPSGMTYSQGYPDMHATDAGYDFRLGEWGKPMGLPTPTEPTAKTVKKTTKSTTKPLTKSADKKSMDNGKSPGLATKLTYSPVKKAKEPETDSRPVYVDLAYVPHHGDSNYSNVEFFRKVRARYYVFSGISPSKEVLNALLEAKKSWNEDLEVTVIPTYETDTLGYWLAQNQDTLAAYSIEVAPSASRCTVNLQDHETSCAAYRLEF